MRVLRGALLGAVAVGMAAVSGSASAQKTFTLFTLTDAKGDDRGAGDLIYPPRDDMQPGDLDLVSLSAETARGGTWFTATFAAPVRSPSDRTSQLGPERLDRIARHGFYTLNLDIYIDTDRRPGSGSTATVPGRYVQIDRRDAWEKAIILTPRPDVARTLMVQNAKRVLEEQRRAQTGVVSGQDFKNIDKTVEETVDRRYFFPTKVQVSQRQIRFFVADEFLGGKANPAWAYTAFVTGAEVEPRQRLVDMPFKDDSFSVLMMQTGTGRQRDRFSVPPDADPGQPAIIDVLTADPALQARMLSDYDVVAGRPPRLVGAVPTGRGQTVWEPYRGAAPEAGVTSVAKEGTVVPFQPSERDAAAALSGAPILADPANDAITAATGPASSSGSGAASAALGGKSGERKTVAQRLRELTDLRQQNLITDEEYQDARRKILSGI